jgi:DNA-binding response OmpR family regulator
MAVQEGQYDVVLMDVQMPVVDGVTATRRIRELDGPCGTVPIIAMTANVLPEQVAKFMKAGMDGHVGKPFKREELHAAIAAALAPRGGPETGAPEKGGAAIDAAVLGELVDVMGLPGARRLLENLEERLTEMLSRIALTPEDRGRLARDAHALVSATGMIGFGSLSILFREFEATCLDETAADLGPVVGRVRTSLESALAEIALLREAA